MPLEIPCPECGAVLRAPDGSEGRKARCKKCQHSFRLPGEPPKDANEQSQALSVVDTPAFNFDSAPAPSSPAKESRSKAKASTAKASAAKRSTRGYQARQAKSGKMPLFIGLGVVVAVALAGTAIYFLTKGDTKAPASSTAKNEPAKKPDEKPKAEEAKSKQEDTAKKSDNPQPKAAAKSRAEGGLTLADPPAKAKDFKKAESTVTVETPFENIRKFFVSTGGEAPYAVMITPGEGGIAGEGAKDNIERYNLNSGAKIDVTPIEAGPWPRACNLSPSGDLFVSEGPPGTVSLYKLNDKTRQGESFKPFAEMMPVPAIASMHFADEKTVLIAAADGKLELWREGKKANSGSLGGPIGPNSIAMRSKGAAFIAVCNGSLVNVPTSTLVPGSGVELPKKAGTCFALSYGGGDRVAVAYEAEQPGLHTLLVITRLDDPKPREIPLGESFGVPLAVEWSGLDQVSVATDKKDVTVSFSANSNRPTAALWPAGGQAKRVLSAGREYVLLPDPADPKKCLLLSGFDFPPGGGAGVLELDLTPKSAKFEQFIIGPEGLGRVE